MLEEYRRLVAEQGEQLELQRDERQQVQDTYEQLISKMQQAEGLKVAALQEECAQRVHAVQNELQQAQRLLASTEEVRVHASNVAQAHATLQMEHSRLLASANLLAESKQLAENEAARLTMENRRLTDEHDRTAMLLYGHKGHHLSSATATANKKPLSATTRVTKFGRA